MLGDPTKDVCFDLPTEENFLVGTSGVRPGRPWTGAFTKYSPILAKKERATGNRRIRTLPVS